jgi:hypothetical protein
VDSQDNKKYSGIDLPPALAEKGYSSALAIANTSQAEFVEVASEHLNEAEAARLHETAQVQTTFLSNVLPGARAHAANSIIAEPANSELSAAQAAEENLQALLRHRYVEWSYRKEERKLLNTSDAYDHSRAYRLIEQNSYSTHTNVPLKDQVYVAITGPLLRPNVIAIELNTG